MGCTIDLWFPRDELLLFNADLLNSIKESDLKIFKDRGLSHKSPGSGLAVRPLHREDFDKGYMELLSQLTKTGEVDKVRFEAQFDALKKCPGIHYIVVIEDLNTSLIVGSASLIVERKFVHTAALRGRIEDVVTHEDYRGRHLASLLMDLLKHLGENLGCYKLSLDCKPHLTDFYSKFGYKQESALYMVQRFYD